MTEEVQGDAPTVDIEQDQTPEPWAPEGAARIGTPPSADGPGERGTSAYEGDGPSDERGPLPGVEYHENASELGTGVTEHARSSARGESSGDESSESADSGDSGDAADAPAE